MRRSFALGLALAVAGLAAVGCSPGADGTGGGGAGGSTWSTSTSTTVGGGGSGGHCDDPALCALLAALRTDRDAALQAQSDADGWPAPVGGGYLFVSAEPSLALCAGDHDGWVGTPMTVESDFAWVVVDAPAGDAYKLTDGTTWLADPWARSYTYDAYGEMSLVTPASAHRERFFNVTDGVVLPRTVRVWRPASQPTHVLYAHDGQNLFDPNAPWGGWQLDASAPPGMLVVGIDNTPARMDEYTQVEDVIDGTTMGGAAPAYADFVETTVRALVASHYGEPPIRGVIGSSLGGLVSFYQALRHPGSYAFAASLSGTMGWGAIGLDGAAHHPTIVESYAAAGHGSTALYLDSGGDGACWAGYADADGDGIDDDDPTAGDNYCENAQTRDVLYAEGYQSGVDFWYWHEPLAEHNEAAWAARVWRPLDIFAGL
ncbi:MAG: hypothetical protein IT373_13235 [Polyangiaceae bacterium]|nr:hypothetical protein [Polyangiaceae bacterium]